MVNTILKQELRIKNLQRQWDLMSDRQDLTDEQRAVRSALDKKLMVAKLELKRMQAKEGA